MVDVGLNPAQGKFSFKTFIKLKKKTKNIYIYIYIYTVIFINYRMQWKVIDKLCRTFVIQIQGRPNKDIGQKNYKWYLYFVHVTCDYLAIR